MARKEFQDKQSPPLEGLKSAPSGISSKLSGLYNKSFGIIKFILGICLLPFVYSVTLSFLGELSTIGVHFQKGFWSGGIALLVIYLFVWEPAIIYSKGHRLLELFFNFFKPLVKVAPYLLPIYTVLIFILYALFSLIIKAGWLLEYSMFLFGWSLVLHLVFSAKSIRGKKGDFLKANYIFGFSFVYILNIALLSFFLNLIFEKFSFVNFANNTYQSASAIFYAAIKQLFLK